MSGLAWQESDLLHSDGTVFLVATRAVRAGRHYQVTESPMHAGWWVLAVTYLDDPDRRDETLPHPAHFDSKISAMEIAETVAGALG